MGHRTPVFCYVYGSAAEDQLVIEVIKEMAAGRVDRQLAEHKSVQLKPTSSARRRRAWQLQWRCSPQKKKAPGETRWIGARAAFSIA
jgi:hypothetical protein